MNVQPIKPLGLESVRSTESNPLLDGLQLVTTEAELIKLIAKNPFRNAEWRKQNQDIDLIRSYMQQVVIPTRLVLKVGVAIHKILKISLHQQDPNKQQNRRQYFATAGSLLTQEFHRGIHDGMCIEGITALGKSHLIDASLSTIPQYIERTDLPGVDRVVQINWIKIDMSGVPSVEALAWSLVAEVDRVLNQKGKLLEMTFKGLNSAQAKMQSAIRMLKTHYCGLIVFDEIQYANFAVANAASLRYWMLKIANVGIGLVFSGNPQGFKLLSPKAMKSKKSTEEEVKYATQVMRRLFAANNIRFDPAPACNHPEWVFFSKAICSCRLSGAAHPYDSDLEEFKFQLTAGFPDFYVELHCSIETILAKNPGKVVDKALIERAARNTSKLKEMKPLIDAFILQDSITLRQCQDVDHEYYQELWKQEYKRDESHQSNGPVEVVSMPDNAVDTAKSLADDQKTAKNRMKRKRAKAEAVPNSAALAVRKNHLDELEKLLSGKDQDKSED